MALLGTGMQWRFLWTGKKKQSSCKHMKVSQRQDPSWEPPAQGKHEFKKPALLHHPAFQCLSASKLPKLFTVWSRNSFLMPLMPGLSSQEPLFYSSAFRLLATQRSSTFLNNTNQQPHIAMPHSPFWPIEQRKHYPWGIMGSGPSASGLTPKGCHKFIPATPHIVTEP